MPGLRAYRSGAVLERLRSGEVPEPYATALYIHGRLGAKRIGREDLFNLELGDVRTEADAVSIQRPDGVWVKLIPSAVYALRAYLKSYRRDVDSISLFPLPHNSERPASASHARRYLTRITNKARSE